MLPSPSTDPHESALHWFVRSQAENFSPEEKHSLETWLKASSEHRRCLQELEQTWKTLDLLQERRHEMPFARQQSPVRPRWVWVSTLLASGCTALYFLWLLPAEEPHYETPPQERKTVTLPGGITVAMNADSAFAVRQRQPLQIELKRGDIYLEVPPDSSGQVEVQMGNIHIQDLGTRFTVQTSAAGGNIAVAEGAVEVTGAGRERRLTAGHSLHFSDGKFLEEQAIRQADVAPWRHGEWLLQKMPVSDMAREITRQTGIRVDLPDSSVSTLTVSGRFSMAQADQMLWAVAQVHGLRLKRFDAHHYALLAP